MQISKITIHNFLRLKDVEMNPSQTNVVVGKNGQGKTSILKAIQTAFEGKIPADAIRMGESKAEITVELDDLTITRSATQKSDSLKITNKDGFEMKAPQRYLDGILGTFSFNPIGFFELPMKDRKQYLLNAIKISLTESELLSYLGEVVLPPLDYTKHALEVVKDAHKIFYDMRTVANAEVVKKENSLKDIASKIPADFDPSTVSEEKIAQLRAGIEQDEKNRVAFDNNQKHIVTLQKQETDFKEQIAALQKRLVSVQDEILACQQTVFDFSDETTIGIAKETLKALESKRDLVFQVKRRDEVSAELDIANDSATRLDAVVKALATVPGKLLEKAQLPVEGLTIEEDTIKVGGVSLDNLSSAEQLKFGLQVVRALNGTFKVVCIDGVEKLDKETFEWFLNEIKDDGFQYFVTRVDGDTEHSFVVQDGAVTQS